MLDSSIESLLKEASELALSIGCGDISSVDRLSEYVEAVESIIVADITKLDPEILKRFQHEHGLLLKAAQDAKGEVASKLKNLKLMGRGLLAYVDPLPKRISLHKSKKG